MNEQPLNFNLDDSFALVSFNMNVDSMSQEQMKEVLKSLYRHHLYYKRTTEAIIRQAWGIDSELNQRPTEGKQWAG